MSGPAELVNWAGNHAYRARRVHHPESVEQVREIVAAAPQVKVLGSRHSFHGIGDADELVSLAALPRDLTVEDGRVSFAPGITYGELARALEREGLALHTMASLPHISVAGAIATATHGSGDGVGNLATAVAALELVTSSGELVRAARGEEDFDGMVVGLGALGAVTRVTLDVEQAYEVAQRAYERLAWDALCERFDEVMGSGYSVSVFTTWGDAADQVWVKSRTGQELPADVLGARPATTDLHPIAGTDPVHCTPQLGRPGPWWDRLAHFRLGFTPSSGEELQSELLLPRERAAEAIEAVRGLAERIRPVLHVSEIRTIAADELWMSPMYGRATVAIHFTWKALPDEVTRVLADVEAALAPLGARPHWGKLFATAGAYERLDDFRRLAERLDPRGAFRNDWLERYVLGS